MLRPALRASALLPAARRHCGHPRWLVRHLSSGALDVQPVTKVEKILLDNIKATGPITLASYTAFCLSHPTDGYYTSSSNPVFGAKGDFITSPEISQVFGELVMIWSVQRWAHMCGASGRMKKLRLVELGPGRGTLMSDMLRVVTQLSAVRSLVHSVHLVETSRPLRSMQEAALAPLAAQLNSKLHWHDMIEDVPEDPEVFTVIVAHEFFDALPFRVVQKTEKGWREVLIASNEATPPAKPADAASSDISPLDVTTPGFGGPSASNSAPSNERFKYVVAPQESADAALLGMISPRFKSLPSGSRMEVSAESHRIASALGRLLSPATGQGEERVDGGAALIVDYGTDRAASDSFRAFKRHKQVSPFHLPGECDLTADVDFALLAEAFSQQATPLPLLTQRAFLTRMPLEQRLARLLKNASNDERRKAIDDGVHRLVDPINMGAQYKFLGVVGRTTGAEETKVDGVFPFGVELEENA